MLCEKYLPDRREINCAAYFSDGKVITSECEEAMTKGDILSFDDKYAGRREIGSARGYTAVTVAKIKYGYRRSLFKIKYDDGIVRFDYILSGGEIYLSEVNTVPGSLSYYLLSSGFKHFYTVLQAVIVQALEDKKALGQKTLLTTGILNNLPSNTCKLGSK